MDMWQMWTKEKSPVSVFLMCQGSYMSALTVWEASNIKEEVFIKTDK